MASKRTLTTSRILMLSVFFALPFVVALPGPVHSGTGEYDASQDIELVTGDIENIKVKNLSRVSITDPDIADISDAKADEVLLMAKKPGQTVLFLWDDYGKRSTIVRVVGQDLNLVKTRISKLLKKTDIKGVNIEENTLEGRVVISGELEKDQLEKLGKILEPFDEKVINLAKEKVYEDQIQIDMQITEVNESVTKSLGIDWTAAGGAGFTNNYQETLPPTDGSIGDFFKIGDFNRTSAMLAKVNAFVKEGKARVLSKPRLVVVSGKEASFLVGGEIPFKTTTLNATGGNVTEDTTFKKYGVNMTITPTIKNGKIEIDLNVEVSDVDASNPSGDEIAFLTRSATTHLNLNDKQTIVLAGLIKKSRQEEVRRIPFISKIPVVGLLFRNRNNPVPNQDTELVISLTPMVLKDKMFAKPKPVAQNASEENQGVGNSSGMGNEDSPIRSYARVLQNQISAAVNYPYEAKENGWEGTVKLSLRILKDGTLASATLKQSSGYDVFDQDALNTAKILAPYPPFSSDMYNEDMEVVVPIVYSQKKS